jgi:REP element-mobilizing transposase RayT
MARGRQALFDFRGWGGIRKGAGRPRRGPACVPHTSRERMTPRDPVHVTVRLVRQVRNLRTRGAALVLRAAFEGGRDRLGFRLVHFSVQPAHLHLIAEADDARALGRGMKGLGVRIARRLNRLLGRRGRVLADRYHARVLRKPASVRGALLYVLQNARHHDETGAPPAGVPWTDPYSSARAFDGWASPPPRAGPAPTQAPPVAAPKAWLLQQGWRRRGLIDPCEAPPRRAPRVRR